jgi:hypothetical protein
MALEGDDSSPFKRQEEKWWLPVPQLPPCGLHENSRKQLQHKRECANQISKAAMAINNATLAEMQVPDTYLESLPKVLLMLSIVSNVSIVNILLRINPVSH